MWKYQARITKFIFTVLLVSSSWPVINAALFRQTDTVSTDHLLINEFLAANNTGIVDEDGEYTDWIEIYNGGRSFINLQNWALTDDPDQPEKWIFPEVTLAPNAYLLVFASGKDRSVVSAKGSLLHTNFRLDQNGEFLALYDRIRGEYGHRFNRPLANGRGGYPKQFYDISFGRIADPTDKQQGTFRYFAVPTPYEKNHHELSWSGYLSPVTFSAKRGIYTQPLSVTLSTETAGASILYTLDGSQPTPETAQIYTATLIIDRTTTIRAAAFKADQLPTPAVAHTYLFRDDVLRQPSIPPGYPPTWGHYQGKPVQADYEMDPNVLQTQSDQVAEALTALPSLVIATEQRNFFDLYTNPQRRGRAWERPVSVEFFDPKGTMSDFQINAGLRIQGKLGRLENMPKHSFRLFFRSDYGASYLDYPLFSDSAVTRFDTLILRAGVNKSFAGWPDSDFEATTYTRDEWLRASQIAMSGSGAHGTFVHLYLNGLYWGLYNVVERPDDAFMAAYFGGSKNDWDWLSHAETISPTIQSVNKQFKTLHQLAQTSRFDQPEKYEAITAYLDVPHFVDMMILNWYSGNSDWGSNNWYAGIHKHNGQVKYYTWDGERTWFFGAEIIMEEGDEYEGQPDQMTPLFNALFANVDFQILVADRIYKHLFNDGVLTTARSQARWLALADMVEPAIVAEAARWGDVRQEPPLDQHRWTSARDNVLGQMGDNVTQFIELARVDHYYPELDPPILSQHGGQIEANLPVSMKFSTGQTGIIYYTTDGTDPRVPVTGDVAPQAQPYTTPLILNTATRLKARVFSPLALDKVGAGWSALTEAYFHNGPLTKRVSITEIMYHPLGGEAYEFIELTNTGNVPYNLAGLHFSGIEFQFPAEVNELWPGQSLVLAHSPIAFSRRYPDVPIAGQYQGKLSNKGERIVLYDGTGNELVNVEYRDDRGWPLSADGKGDSLVLIDFDQNPSSPQAWQASHLTNGSPGYSPFRAF